MFQFGSPQSGRLILAQRFIAGRKKEFATKSVKRTTDKSELSAYSSVVRFTDSFYLCRQPSSKLLGYLHPSAARTKTFLSERKLHSQLQLPRITNALAQETVEVEQRCGGQRVNVVLAIEGIKHLDDWD